MLRLTTLLMVSSLLLAGCDDDRPDANVCIVNVQKLQKGCYNLKNDYDNTGHIKAGVKAKVQVFATRDAMLDALDKNASLDPVSLAHVKAWTQTLHSNKLSSDQIAAENAALEEREEDHKLDDLNGAETDGVSPLK